MVAGDLKLVDVQALVQYRIADLEAFTTTVADPDGCPDGVTLRDAARAGLSEMVGQRSMDDLLEGDRQEIEADAAGKLQRIVDGLRAGMKIVSVRLEQVAPPQPVRGAYERAALAKEASRSLIDAAQAYRRALLSGSEAEAKAIVQSAQDARAATLTPARSDASSFVDVLREYDEAQEAFTGKYLESMEALLPGVSIFILAEAGRSVGSQRLSALGWPSGAGPMRSTAVEGHPPAISVGTARFTGARRSVAPDIHFDNRLLRLDPPVAVMPDVDGRPLVIDLYARYRIADRRQFAETLATEAGARRRLNAIVVDAMRAQVALITVEELVGTRMSQDGGALRPEDTRNQFFRRVLLEVFDQIEVIDLPLGISVSEVRIKRRPGPAWC